MNKLIIAFLALGLALALSSNIKAQDNITVSATVLEAIDVTVNTNISFGNVEAGAVAEIQANVNDGVADDNASDPTPGSVSITAGDQDYIITQSAAAVLALSTDNLETLAFTARYYQGTDNRTAAITGAGHTVTGGGDITLDIGGQLASPTVTGIYGTGETGGTHLQITVAYSGL